MQNHMTKKVFRNSRILHFLGVKSRIYHFEKLYLYIIISPFEKELFIIGSPEKRAKFRYSRLKKMLCIFLKMENHIF